MFANNCDKQHVKLIIPIILVNPVQILFNHEYKKTMNQLFFNQSAVKTAKKRATR